MRLRSRQHLPVLRSVLAFAVVAALIATGAGLFFKVVPDDNREVLLMLLTLLVTEVRAVFAWVFPARDRDGDGVPDEPAAPAAPQP